MTDYTVIPAGVIETNKPILASTIQQIADNPTAITEGAPDAPRNELKSFARVVAGATIRSRKDGLPTTSSDFPEGVIHEFSFMQIGTVRAIITRDSVGSVQVVRLRNGVRTILSGPVDADISADVAVQPFDKILLEANTSGSSASFNGRFATDGGDLWAGSSARVEGNNV